VAAPRFGHLLRKNSVLRAPPPSQPTTQTEKADVVADPRVGHLLCKNSMLRAPPPSQPHHRDAMGPLGRPPYQPFVL
jgi:hypothetical protein